MGPLLLLQMGIVVAVVGPAAGELHGFGPLGEEVHTFANNSIAQVAALKQLDIIKRDNLLENVNNVGAHFAAKLAQLFEHLQAIEEALGVEIVERFEVDRHWVTVAALKALADDGAIAREKVAEAIAKYGLDVNKPNPMTV